MFVFILDECQQYQDPDPAENGPDLQTLTVAVTFQVPVVIPYAWKVR